MTFYIKGIYMKLTQYFQLLYSIVIETCRTTCNITVFLLIIVQVCVCGRGWISLEELAICLPLGKRSVVLHIFMDSFLPRHIHFGLTCI